MKLVSILMALCVPGCATAIPGLGLPTSGVVVDKATGSPISGAYVVMHVDGLAPFQGFQCERVEIVESGADGAFATRPWAQMPLGQRQEQYYVYKPGYALESITAGLRLNMKRQEGGNSERRQHLNDLAPLLPCLGDPSLDVIHVLELIAAEAESLSGTAEERASVLRTMNRRIQVERNRVSAKAQRTK